MNLNRRGSSPSLQAPKFGSARETEIKEKRPEDEEPRQKKKKVPNIEMPSQNRTEKAIVDRRAMRSSNILTGRTNKKQQDDDTSVQENVVKKRRRKNTMQSELLPIRRNSEGRQSNKDAGSSSEELVEPVIRKKSTVKVKPVKTVNMTRETEQVIKQLQPKGLLLHIFDASNLPMNSTYTIIKQHVDLWVGQTYYKVCQMVFDMMQAGQLSLEEMKVHYSKNIILNSVHALGQIQKYFVEVWKQHKARFIQDMNASAISALTFLMRKYPIKSLSVSTNTQLERIIVQFDKLKEPENNSMAIASIDFSFKQNANYDSQIKSLVNFYFKCSKKFYPNFSQSLKKIFTLTANEVETYHKVNRAFSLNSENVADNALKETMLKLPEDSTSQKRAHTLKHQISMKFNPNLPMYTYEELKSTGITIKSPEVLRILIKWIEHLEKRIESFADGGFKQLSFNHKMLKNRKVSLTQKQISNLKVAVNQAKESGALQTPVSEVNLALAEVYECIQRNKHMFRFIPSHELIVGLATAIVSDPVQKTLSGHLSSLIHCLLETEDLFNQTMKENKVALMSFGIYDLLRARCSGSVDEIGSVYKRLLTSGTFEIIRIKNRMETVNKDFLLNLKMIGTPLICQLQMIVEEPKSQESKQVSTYHLSHFLYELQRSKFGPLGEAYIVTGYLNPTVNYFDRQLKNVRLNSLDFYVDYSEKKRVIKIVGFLAFLNKKSFTCNNCWKFIDSSASFIPSFEEIKKNYPRRICYNCVIDRMPQKHRKMYLTDDLAPILTEVKEKDLWNYDQKEMMFIYAIKPGTNKAGQVFRLFKHSKISQPKLIRSFLPFPLKILQSKDGAFKYIFKFINQKPIILKSKDIAADDMMPNTKVDRGFVKQSNQDIYAFAIPNLKKRLLVDYSNDMIEQKMLAEIQIVEYLQLEPTAFNQNSKQFSQKRDQFICRSDVKLTDVKLLYCDFLQLNTLKQLNLSQNKLQEINFKQFNIRQLTKIDLSTNELSQFNIQGCQFPYLTSICLKHNRLEKVVMSKDMPRIQTILLSHNYLRDLNCFNGLQLGSLKKLYIKENKLKVANVSKWKLTELEYLTLKDNFIRDLDGFQVLTGLKSLDLSNNMMQKFTASKWRHQHLQILNISLNRLESATFQGSRLTALTELHLEFNYLQDFDFGWVVSPHLISIVLHFNYLNRICLVGISLPAECKIYAQHNKIYKLKIDQENKSSIFPHINEKLSEMFYVGHMQQLVNWVINQMTVDRLSEYLRGGGIAQLLPQSGYLIGNHLPPFMRYIMTDTNKMLYRYVMGIVPQNQV